MMELDYASVEEQYFHWYLQELIDAGYIEKIKYQPKPFILSDKVSVTFTEQLKTKTKEVSRSLMKGHQYTADFMIIWTSKGWEKFWINSVRGRNNPLSYPFVLDQMWIHNRSIIDVKGTFNRDESWTKFSIAQKWVWQKYSLYVQKIIPEKLFKATFTPQRYLLTDKSMKPRKLKWEPRTLNEYVNSR